MVTYCVLKIYLVLELTLPHFELCMSQISFIWTCIFCRMTVFWRCGTLWLVGSLQSYLRITMKWKGNRHLLSSPLFTWHILEQWRVSHGVKLASTCPGWIHVSENINLCSYVFVKIVIMEYSLYWYVMINRID